MVRTRSIWLKLLVGLISLAFSSAQAQFAARSVPLDLMNKCEGQSYSWGVHIGNTESVAACTEIIESDTFPKGSRATAFYYRAMANDRLRIADAALSDFRTAIDFAPDHPSFRMALALLLAKSGDFLDAYTELTHAMKAVSDEMVGLSTAFVLDAELRSGVMRSKRLTLAQYANDGLRICLSMQAPDCIKTMLIELAKLDAMDIGFWTALGQQLVILGDPAFSVRLATYILEDGRIEAQPFSMALQYELGELYVYSDKGMLIDIPSLPAGDARRIFQPTAPQRVALIDLRESASVALRISEHQLLETKRDEILAVESE